MKLIKQFFIVVLCVALMGCQEVFIQNPEPVNVVGKWEYIDSSNPFFSYLLIEFDEIGNAVIITTDANNEGGIVAYLKEFRSDQSSFSSDIDFDLNFFNFDEHGQYDDPEGAKQFKKLMDLLNKDLRISGVVGSVKMCLDYEVPEGSDLDKELKKDGPEGSSDLTDNPFCFTKTSDLDIYRQNSFELLNKLKKN